jgi:hypothetical protein
MAEIAAIHGVYRRQKTSKAMAEDTVNDPDRPADEP